MMAAVVEPERLGRWVGRCVVEQLPWAVDERIAFDPRSARDIEWKGAPG
jgi:hypothetical protein